MTTDISINKWYGDPPFCSNKIWIKWPHMYASVTIVYSVHTWCYWLVRANLLKENTSIMNKLASNDDMTSVYSKRLMTWLVYSERLIWLQCTAKGWWYVQCTVKAWRYDFSVQWKADDMTPVYSESLQSHLVKPVKQVIILTSLNWSLGLSEAKWANCQSSYIWPPGTT